MRSQIKKYLFQRHIKRFGNKNNGYFNYFNKEWFVKHQRTLVWLLNHWLLKYWFRWILRIHKDCKFNEFIDIIKPHTYRVKVNENTYRSDFRTHQKFSKRIYYAFCPLWWSLHFLDFLIQKTLAPDFSFGFDTLTNYPDAHTESTTFDGILFKSSDWWPTLRTAASADEAFDEYQYADLWDMYDGESLFYISRAIFLFDTSTLTASANVSLININFYGQGTLINSDSDAWSTCISSPASNTSINVADYNDVTDQVGYIGFNVWNSSGYNSMNLNPNSLVDTAGITKLGARVAGDVANLQPTGSNRVSFYMADQSGTSNDPKLVVTYTLPSTFVPQIGNVI